MGEFASQTALAVLRTRAAARLGLSALIAFAFAGCGNVLPDRGEVPPDTYKDILSDAQSGYEAQQCVNMIPGFMSDGKITYDELGKLNACDDAAANAAALARLPETKRWLANMKRQLAQVGRNPKGQDAEERLGAKHEHAVREADAPK